MSEAPRDQNHVPTALFESSDTPGLTLPGQIDEITGRILVDASGGGAGTVTSVSVVSANGFAGSVATATTTLAITISTTVTGILQGDGTAISAASTTGSGAVVLANTPTLITPVLGVATATSINGLTITSSTGTLTITNGKTLSVSNTLTFTGTDASSVAFGTGGTVVYTNVTTLSSLVSVGTITTGTWSATTIAVTKGGTGVTAISALSIWLANSANTITEVTPGAGNSIRINAGGTAWEAFTPSASTPTVITVANEATDTSCFIGFFTAATGDLGPKTNANLTFNSNTGVLTSASSVLTTTDINGGTIDGTVIGGASAAAVTSTIVVVDNLTIDLNTISSTSGNLNITPVAGSGIVLDGTITVDAGVVTGITSLGVTGTRVTAGFFTDLTVTNAIAGSITGNAVTTTVADEATDTSCFITFATAATGSLGTKTNTNMTFNSNTGVATFASTVLTTTDINGGTVDGAIIGGASAAAATVTTLVVNTSALPDANDGAPLGAAGTAWSDLFLAEGGVINWDSSDFTITQAGNLLTFAGGEVLFGANTAGFTVTDNGNSGTSDTIDWKLGNKQKSTLTGNCTFTFTAPSNPCSLVFECIQDGTVRTITWPATVKWSAGAAPTMTGTSGRSDIISLYWNGTVYYATYTLNHVNS